MRYLHNYKGTTLPLKADWVKNWLLSPSLVFFFSTPLSRRVIYDSIGEYISPAHWNSPHFKSPSPHKEQTQMGQTGGSGTPSHGVHLQRSLLIFELTWYPHIDTQTKYSRSHCGPTTALISSQLSLVKLGDRESNDAGCMREDVPDVELCSCSQLKGGMQIWNRCKFVLDSIYYHWMIERKVLGEGSWCGGEKEEQEGEKKKEGRMRCTLCSCEAAPLPLWRIPI